MRTIQIALSACLLSACSVSSTLAEKPVGLICTSRNRGIVRLNLDLARGEFQKDGFPKASIAATNRETIILVRHVGPELTITASLDRRTLTYTAQTEDRLTRHRVAMDYRCLRGPVFETMR